MDAIDPQAVLGFVRLVRPNGEESTHSVLQSPFNIGRIEPNNLVLPSPSISRFHARILIEDDQVFVVDLNSSNGTLLEGAKIPPNEPTRLAYGQAVSIGGFTLTVLPAPAPVSPPEPEGEKDGSGGDAPPAAGPAAPAAPESGGLEAEPGHDRARARARERKREREPEGIADRPGTPAIDRPIPYEEAFGLPEDRSRYMRYLPPIYEDGGFLDQFLLAFEAVLAPIESAVDNFDLYLSPATAPAFFLDQIAAWLGLTLDEKWPLEKRRGVVAEAADLYRRRGTRRGLVRHLEIYTGVTPEVIEPQTETDPPHHFKVILRLPPGERVDRGAVEQIIQVNKPAHTTYELMIYEP